MGSKTPCTRCGKTPVQYKATKDLCRRCYHNTYTQPRKCKELVGRGVTCGWPVYCRELCKLHYGRRKALRRFGRRRPPLESFQKRERNQSLIIFYLEYGLAKTMARYGVSRARVYQVLKKYGVATKRRSRKPEGGCRIAT